MKKTTLMALFGTIIIANATFAQETIKENMNTEKIQIQEVEDNQPKLNYVKKNDKGEGFMKKLKLTPEQAEKAKELHKKGVDEIKPVMEEMKILRTKAHEIREKNKKEFESILTSEQKEILKELEEKHKRLQKRKPRKLMNK